MKRLAFVIDYPYYHGGAHIATFSLINRLKADGYQVDVISPNIPECGFRKRAFQICKHSHIGWYPNWVLDPDHSIRKNLSSYDILCCIGEPSICRKLISQIQSYSRKILLIHTDYSTWINIDKSAKEHCRFDKWWYPRYDCIGVVGKENAKRMSCLFPKISEKIMPFHNILDSPHIKHIPSNGNAIKIITVIRVGAAAKCTHRYIEAAKCLKNRGIIFCWSIYGNGDKLEEFRDMTLRMNISDSLHFKGYIDNIPQKLCNADIMVLLSNYEGLPNTIYESFLCGTPVFSTNVGSISEQITEGENGWLVPNSDEEIINKLAEVISDKTTILKYQNNLSNYQYDNENAYSELHTIIMGQKKGKFTHTPYQH